VLNALTKKHIQLMTTGEEERQFIYGADCVKNLYLIQALKEDEFDLSNGDWISIKRLGETIANKLGATVSVGDVKGYNNHIDPKFNTQYFSFDYDLSAGIDEVIENGKKYLANQ
jgi:nucleoside-diphosphate-sugar epimerase